MAKVTVCEAFSMAYRELSSVRGSVNALLLERSRIHVCCPNADFHELQKR